MLHTGDARYFLMKGATVGCCLFDTVHPYCSTVRVVHAALSWCGYLNDNNGSGGNNDTKNDDNTKNGSNNNDNRKSSTTSNSNNKY